MRHGFAVYGKPDERKYSYGDTVSVDLEPHEIRIFKFTNENTAPLKLTEAKFIDEKTVEFRFNSHIAVKMSTFTLDGVALKKSFGLITAMSECICLPRAKIYKSLI